MIVLNSYPRGGYRHGAGLLSLAAACLLTSHAAGQDWQRLAPKEPPANQPAVLPVSPPSSRLPDGNTAILPALKGLVFVPAMPDIRPAGVNADGIVAPSIDLLQDPAFRERLAPFLGRPLTLSQLNEIARITVLFYRDHDRPLVDVVVPEQNISKGTVQVLVVEFRAGTITAEQNRWFSDDQLLENIRTKTGDRISARSLLEDVDWLNRNPFRRVDLVYQRGKEPGTSDIVMRAPDRFPLRVFGGYENTGTRTTDNDRIFAGFNWGNAFWADQQISYQLSASPDFWSNRFDGGSNAARYLAHAGSWVIALPWRHTLTLFGSASRSRPDAGAAFHQTGTSYQASARYGVPLPQWESIAQEFQVGVDWKRTNNNLDFGGTSVFANSTDIAQAMIGYTANRPDKAGTTAANISLFASPGGINGRNSDHVFQTSRAAADSRYAYGRISVDRLTKLPEDFVWRVRAVGQLSTGNLLSSEQLDFGGNASIRGYGESEALGDQGILLSTELRTPEISPFALAGEPNLGDTAQALIFADFGYATLKHKQTGERGSHTLLGVGPGIRFNLPPYLAIKLDWGFQLIDSKSGPERLGRPHVGITLSY